ncbi:MAG TPA: hypothetical protein VM183_03845 [Burkholderiales bacterium]|nr:hypothetical protein [Burkholderiales bacterium]
MIRSSAILGSVILGCAVGFAHAQVPAKKAASTERKAATPARGSYEKIKGTGAARKKSDAGARGAARQPGMDPQGTEAQGIAR